MNIDTIFPVLISVIVVAVVLVIALKQSKKAKANLTVLGQKLGLSLETKGRWFKKHRLVGQLRGKATEVFAYTTGSGKSQRKWVAIAVQVKGNGGLTFSLKRRMTLFEFVARLFRKNEAKTGDMNFDEKWLLTTNQPDFMRAALLPETREKIMRLSGGGLASSNYKLALSKVQYSEQSSFSRDKLCTRFEELAPLVCDLADVVEVGAELQK